jgi:predicted enzyme related to lactoylglutathione lyase
MPDRDSYAPGTPSWVDIGSPDLDKTHAFYTGLFGWER